MGESGLEFIQLLLEKKELIISTTQKDTASQQQPIPTPKASGSKKGISTGHRPGPQISIITQEDKQLQKLLRKQKTKVSSKNSQTILSHEQSLAAFGFDPKQMKQIRFKSVFIFQLSNVNIKKKKREKELKGSPDSYLPPAGTYGPGLTSSNILPEGTIRYDYSTHREVIVPPQQPRPFGANERLVPIEEFDEFGQMVFKGFKTLNRIQSQIYEAAYKSNENLLICAPTGAGKTNVALMAMVREIRLHLFRGKLIKG